MRNIKLSQCMIVKDEEKNIERALSWGREIMWEQIVVDTGSSDRTVELAWAMGAKVYHFPWIDDFSAAKNHAIEQASGDWIAFLDADEYFDAEAVERLLPLLERAEKSGCYALRTTWLCINDDGRKPTEGTICRVFKRMPELRYQYSIHEQLALKGELLDSGRMLDAAGEMAVHHDGYIADAIGSKDKTRRDIRLLLKELEKRPQDYYLMEALGGSYFQLEDGDEEAERWFRKAIQLMPHKFSVQKDRNVTTFMTLLLILYKKKDEAGLLEIYEDASRRFVGIYDLDYIVARYYIEARENYQKGVFYLERALRILDQYGANTFSPMMTARLMETWELLAECYYQTGDMNSCVSTAVSLLKIDKSRIVALKLLLQAFSKEAPRNVVSFLEKLYDFRQEQDREILLNACRQAGADAVLDYMNP